MTYTIKVKKGDTMSSIAQSFNIALQVLEAANPGINPGNIQIDQVLYLPAENLDGARATPSASVALKTSTPSSKSTNADTSSLTDDQKAALEVHNKARTCMSNTSGTPRPALKWSSTLAKEAADYAAHLMSIGNFQHSGMNGEGENLAKFMPTTAGSLTKGVEMWCAEEKDYHCQPIDGNFGKYGHWTQVIWPSTTEVGLGIARGNGACLVVGRY